MKEFFDSIAKILEFLTSSPASTVLSLVGLVLLVVAGILAYVAVKSKPEEMSGLLRVILFVALVGGMMFSAAGPSVALLKVASIQTMNTDQALKNLEENAPVNYLVRLIAYDPATDPNLSIDRLEKLGPPDQLYSFVASYDELVGHKVLEALKKVGQSTRNIKKVSAVIFRRETSLYPANARGLLQIVRDIEERPDKQAHLTKKLVAGTNALNNPQLEDLGKDSIPSYRLSSFQDKYQRYCELAYDFACHKPSYSAQAYLGAVSKDWHPLGFSQDTNADRCLLSAKDYCEFKDWKSAKDKYKTSFGSRVFLIRNLEINNIPGRILIDFDQPGDQLIPDIGKR